MFEALRGKIAEREARLAELERERIVVEAEVRAYLDALALVTASTPTRVASVLPGRRRSLNWSDILSPFVSVTEPASFSIEDVIHSAQQRGVPVPTRGNIRSQMAAMVMRGRAERISDGVFRLTEDGALGLISGTDDTDESAADTDEESAAQ